MTNEEFKKIIIKRSYTYSKDIILFIDTLNKKDFVIQTLCNQLLRSATSICANIIEAQAASSRRDFINFLNYALKSANESKFWLALLRDTKKADDKKVILLLNETNEQAKILGASIKTLKLRKI